MNRTEYRVLLVLDRGQPMHIYQIARELQSSGSKVQAALWSLCADHKVKRKQSGAWMVAKEPPPVVINGLGAANLFPAPGWKTSGGLWG